MASQILTDSYKLTGKPIYVEPATCERLQRDAFFLRYRGVPLWHRWMERELKEKGCLLASNGFMRRFYGRKDDRSTVTQGLAHIPQVVTTGQTMTALLNLWCDPENRRADGSLVVEPIHTVHDSLLTSFQQPDLLFATTKLNTWFDNIAVVATVPLKIPVESSYGLDWKHQTAL
jgi:hypothetical protein